MPGFEIGKMPTLRSILQSSNYCLNRTEHPSFHVKTDFIEGCPGQGLSISSPLKVRMKLYQSPANYRRHRIFVDARNDLREETVFQSSPHSIH